MSFIFWFISFWSLSHFLWILWIKYGFSKPTTTGQAIDNLPGVSVLIPLRNEADNLQKLIQSLKQQNYPSHKVEFIFIDDHSEDNSLEILEKEWALSLEYQHLIETLPADKKCKKAALMLGIQNARFEYILTTDADCIHSKNWVSSMVQAHISQKAALTGGLIQYPFPKTRLQQLVSYESHLLNTHALALAKHHRPILINGANMLFSKNIFKAVNGYQEHHHIASGDDIFLLHSVKKEYGPSSVHLCFEQDAIVHTQYPKTWSNFFKQRIRWAGKAKYYRDWDTIWISTYLGIMSISWIFIIVTCIFTHNYHVLILALSSKLILDYILLNVSSFDQKSNFWSIFWGLIYPIYALGISLSSFFIKPVWRGR